MSKCTTKNCNNKAGTRGKCTRHNVEDNPICTIPECEHHQIAGGLCWMHWRRNNRYGNPNIMKFRHPIGNHGESGTRLYNKWTGIVFYHNYNGTYIDYKNFLKTKPGNNYLMKCKNGELYWYEYLPSTYPEYTIWQDVKKNAKKINIYIHSEWKDSALTFYKDVGSRPINGRLTRRNKTKGFTPSNCYWRICNPRRSIDKEIAKEIKKMLKNGIKVKDIATHFNINHDLVYKIKAGRTWKDA